VRRQSEAAMALWISLKKEQRREGQSIQSGVALRLPPHSKDTTPKDLRLANACVLNALNKRK
jgi:hypothetical protein